jgi:hypothetical protein
MARLLSHELSPLYARRALAQVTAHSTHHLKPSLRLYMVLRPLKASCIRGLEGLVGLKGSSRSQHAPLLARKPSFKSM